MSQNNFIHKIWENLICFPKSLYVNLKLLPFSDALKFPFWIHPHTRFGKLCRNSVTFNCPITRKMIYFGFPSVKGIPGDPHAYLSIEDNAHITFNGFTVFATGCTLRANGIMIFGTNFSANNCTFISCSDQMIFGDNVLIGWNVNIRDTDGHTIIDPNGIDKPKSRPISIGNHVWIGAHSHILRGAAIGDDSVIAYGSTVLHSFPESNLIIGGYPAKVISSGTNWRK